MTLDDCLYFDPTTNKIMLDVDKFGIYIALSFRFEVPEGFYGRGIGELLDQSEPKS